MPPFEDIYFSDLSTADYLELEIQGMMEGAAEEWRTIAKREGYYVPPSESFESLLDTED